MVVFFLPAQCTVGSSQNDPSCFCNSPQSELTKQQNMFKIELKLLEDELLTRLSAAESNFLGDNVLVEKLETTKHTAAEIEMKVTVWMCAGCWVYICFSSFILLLSSLFPSQVLEAKVNEVKINEAREHYRPVAVRASLLYFIMNDLNKINSMYQFSLKVTRWKTTNTFTLTV